jgi:hypothetical protein
VDVFTRVIVLDGGCDHLQVLIEERPATTRRRTSSMLSALGGLLAVAVLLTSCTGSSQVAQPSSTTKAPLPTIAMSASSVELTVALTKAEASSQLPPAPIDALSCVGRFCMVAAGDLALAVTIGASAERPPVGHVLVPHASGARFAVSCVSATFCLALAVDGSGRDAIWDGHSWSAHRPFGAGVLSGLAGSAGLACASPTLCVAIAASGAHGAASLATFTGSGWTTQRVNTTGQTLTQVSCAAAKLCYALAAHGALLSSSGSTWSSPSVLTTARASGSAGGSNYATSLACAPPSDRAATFCVAVGSGGSVAETSGGAFAPTSVGPLSDVSPGACGSAQFCLVHRVGAPATTSLLLVGNQVTKVSGTEALAPETLLSCTSARLCVSVASSGSGLNVAAAG